MSARARGAWSGVLFREGRDRLGGLNRRRHAGYGRDGDLGGSCTAWPPLSFARRDEPL